MSKKNNYKVYVHINKVNGKRYFGITKQKVEERWRNGKGYSDNEYFYRAINKYGWNEGFEHIVIAKGLTEEEAKFLEIELIREHDTTNRDKGYNISLGGESWNHSEETRKKISEGNKGHEVTEETRKKLSEAMKGKTHSEETRKKISESHKGKNHPMYGKTHTEETRKKLSEAMKGKNAGKGGTKVYCVELEQYFDTVTEASECVGCSHSNISKVLNGRTKTAKGYHWIYAEKIEIENSKVS